MIGASLFSGRAEPAPRASSDAEKVSGALITSLSVGVSGSWRERWGPTGCARLPSTIAYAFGSEAWAISSQALWMHGPGVLSILQSLKLAGVPSAERALLVGLCCGIAIAVRVNNVIFVGPLLCWILITDRRSFLWCTVPVLILGNSACRLQLCDVRKPDRIQRERFQRRPSSRNLRCNASWARKYRRASALAVPSAIWPLQMASVIGFCFTVFGILVFVYVVTCFLVEGRSVPGVAFLASLIAIFSGAQMFALGIMGQYLTRMHFGTMERPTYVVWESTDDQSDHEKQNPAQAVFAIGVGRSPLLDESTLSNQASECGLAKVSCKGDSRLNKKCTIAKVDR